MSYVQSPARCGATVSKTKASTRAKSAFTLIELLVVIAIIAILAAILFPVFAQARDKARQTSALSNMKQIGTALQMYLQDFDETLPITRESAYFLGYADDPEELEDLVIYKTLAPYVKSDAVWFSGSDRLENRGGTSFAQNAHLEYAYQLGDIARPAECIYITDRSDIPPGDEDGDGVIDDPEEHYSWWTFTDPPITALSDLPGTLDYDAINVQISPKRYSGNVACYQFLDGHVKAMRFEQTWGDETKNMHFPFKK
ncbi:MAG: prepilin-type N-terminal cleavage/methylation domain-containing protein [Fibrella sp.]|nr:prepilin-type N-terminal cleavage/methylation domain-containing protein [Armatimonadota bacterium]